MKMVWFQKATILTADTKKIYKARMFTGLLIYTGFRVDLPSNLEPDYSLRVCHKIYRRRFNGSGFKGTSYNYHHG